MLRLRGNHPSLPAHHHSTANHSPISTTTTTSANNGITTYFHIFDSCLCNTNRHSSNSLEPWQPGMVSNRDEFCFVKSGDFCDQIAISNDISFYNLLTWNPQIKSDCTGLRAQSNVCVGTIDFTPPTCILNCIRQRVVEHLSTKSVG